jgi:hypothetical protein
MVLAMEAIRKRATVREDGKVTVCGLPYRKGDRVEVSRGVDAGYAAYSLGKPRSA